MTYLIFKTYRLVNCNCVKTCRGDNYVGKIIKASMKKNAIIKVQKVYLIYKNINIHVRTIKKINS